MCGNDGPCNSGWQGLRRSTAERVAPLAAATQQPRNLQSVASSREAYRPSACSPRLRPAWRQGRSSLGLARSIVSTGNDTANDVRWAVLSYWRRTERDGGGVSAARRSVDRKKAHPTGRFGTQGEERKKDPEWLVVSAERAQPSAAASMPRNWGRCHPRHNRHSERRTSGSNEHGPRGGGGTSNDRLEAQVAANNPPPRFPPFLRSQHQPEPAVCSLLRHSTPDESHPRSPPPGHCMHGH